MQTLNDLLSDDGVFKDGDWVERKDQDPDGEVRLVQLADIGETKFKDKSNRYLTKRKAKELNCTFLKQGDVLISRLGEPLAKACIFPLEGTEKFVTAVDICIYRSSEVNNKWLMYWLNTPQFKRFVDEYKTGTTRKRISRRNLARIKFPVPPTNEQKRIVSKIEELFSVIKNITDMLSVQSPKISIFRKKYLEQCYTGKATFEFRKKNKPEPVTSKLKKHAYVKEELWKERHPRNKYKTPRKVDETELTKLPDTWAWVNIEKLSDGSKHAIKAGPFGSSLKKSSYVEKGYKVYGQEQVIRNDPHYGDYYINEDRYRKLCSCVVQPNDVLISLVGTTGKVLILPDDIEPGVINPRLIKLTLDKELVNLEYFKYFFETPQFNSFQTLYGHGATMKILNLTILRSLPIPLPPLTEQKEIVGGMKAVLSVLNVQNTETENILGQMDSLKQSLLKKAFEGKLVN